MERILNLYLGKTFFKLIIMIFKKEKILFFAPIFEYPTSDGPSISVQNAIKVLARTSNLHVISIKEKSSKNFSSTAKFYSSICNNILFLKTPLKQKKSFKKFLISRIFDKLFLPLNSFYYSLKILRYLNINKINLIWIDRVIEKSFFVYFYLEIIRKVFRFDFKIIADNEAVYSEFILRELNFLKKNSFRFFVVYFNGLICKQFEQYMLATADVITAVSNVDKEIYYLMNPKSNVKLFSNTIDMDLYNKEYNLNFKIKKKSILLLGHFGYKNSPMNRARKWLYDEIMPLVWAKDPSIHLYIVGKNALLHNDIDKNDKTSIFSNVDSTIPFLKGCSILVIPLRHESGTRFKIIEGGAAKIPCVSTSLGAEGLEIEHNKNILISDNAKEFADNILRLIKDDHLSQIIGEEMYKLIKKNYSINNQTKEAEIIISELV